MLVINYLVLSVVLIALVLIVILVIFVLVIFLAVLVIVLIVVIPVCLYYLTRISRAVVCGGMLKVMKLEWRIQTRIPGIKRLKSIGRPIRSKMNALFGTLNRIIERGLPLLIVVKLRF